MSYSHSVHSTVSSACHDSRRPPGAVKHASISGKMRYTYKSQMGLSSRILVFINNPKIYIPTDLGSHQGSQYIVSELKRFRAKCYEKLRQRH
ncbi:hypothetical protein EVAR_43568_1 [Eumeta japonica]|uniref:Uncharacterized protein n=1 Tax=Eumeta variegata TaxID=151549 RepID=A0A4C1XCL1_EUMVA|nr:hypothetical protein EVAR_43568_1 [Eumeta japonica]